MIIIYYHPWWLGDFFLDQSLSMIIDHELIIIWTMDCTAFFKKLICKTNFFIAELLMLKNYQF